MISFWILPIALGPRPHGLDPLQGLNPLQWRRPDARLELAARTCAPGLRQGLNIDPGPKSLTKVFDQSLWMSWASESF